MKLDHIVVHIDNDPELLKKLKSEAERCGFPFDPSKGKGTRGLRVANLWVGDQYLEIPRILRKDGGSWTEDWVTKFNEGKRGVYCLFLRASNLERLQSDLSVRGIRSSLERTSYKGFLGLYRVTMPWRYLRLAPIPDSDFEIGFFEMEEGVSDKKKQRMIPNSGANGIVGFGDVDIMLPSFEKALPFLKAVFAQLVDEGSQHAKVSLDGSEIHFYQSPQNTLEVVMDAQSKNDELVGKSFSFQNVTLRTKPVRST